MSGKSGHSCLVSDLREKFSLTTKYDVRTGFVDGPYHAEDVPPYF